MVAGIGLLTAMFLPFGVGKILRGTLGLGLIKTVLFDLPVGVKLLMTNKLSKKLLENETGLKGLGGIQNFWN